MANSSPLPKGFHYLTGSTLQNKYKILSRFISYSSQSFELVEFPPLAMFDTFEKGATLLGDKVYTFSDKKNRQLLLTPDPIAHVFNYYLSRHRGRGDARLAYISPAFRYRNISNRHFYQIGFSSVNYDAECEIDELTRLTESLVGFVREFFSGKLSLHIVNPGLVMEIIGSIFKDENRTTEFYNKIRQKDVNSILSDLADLPTSSSQEDLVLLFNGKLNDSSVWDKRHFKELSKIGRFMQFSDLAQVDIFYELQNLYCTEILDGVGFEIKIENHKIGDGGIYNLYSNRYNTSIKRFISVCTGIDAINRCIKDNPTNE